MDEDSPSMNDSLSYAEDVPYEAQLADPTGQESNVSLKKRIGQRIYLLEDTMSKKRKLVDVEDDAEEEAMEGDADLLYRPNAILLQGPPVAQLPTAGIFAYATHFDAHPIGLEWVDDQTCVLVFVSRATALHGWDALCRKPQLVNRVTDEMEGLITIEPEGVDETCYPAQPLPLALYPIEDRINTVLGNQKSDILKGTIGMRWARTTDVKERSARLKSKFYKRHGEQAGKGLPVFSDSNRHAQAVTGNKRRKQNDDEEVKRQLDAELDLFLEEDESALNPLDLPLAGTENRKSRVPEDRLRIQEETRRILDDQLDYFVANGSEATEKSPESNWTSSGRSLLERTSRSDISTQSRLPREGTRQTKPLPRRSRRKGRDDTVSTYRTDANGRWLHNAEVTSRSRGYYDDDDGFGMRGWSSEQPQQPKVQKSQEELDRELDQLWK